MVFPLSVTAQSNSAFIDEKRGFWIWGLEQIVSYPGEPDKYWPNKGDLVFDKANGFRYVVEVDQTTGMSTLERVVQPTEPPEDADDHLVYVGPGYASESFRLLYDNSTTPATIVPSDRLYAFSSQADYYKVFLGADISDKTGIVISEFYDASGTSLGSSIPLETDELDSQIVKTHYPGKTSYKLKDNDLVTVVHYSATKGMTSQAQLLVQETEAVRQADTSKRYVSNISLESPFISSSDPRLIEFPLNVTVESLPMTGIIHYSDGKTFRQNIDGINMSLNGLRNYIATEVGQEFDLSLVYELANDEISYGVQPTTNRRLVESYRARTAPVDGAYMTRLFVYPVWQSEALGYRLEFWLYNMDRNVSYNVTPLMELGANSRPFNPTSYGTLQTLTYAVNLNRVDGRFLPMRAVFNFQVALLATGSNRTANWEIYSRPDQDQAYGRGLKADLEYVNANAWNLYLQNGAQSQTAWLKQMYFNAEPLINPDLEAVAPTPTHFQLVFLHNTYEKSVSQWNETHRIMNDLKDGELLYIKWIQRTVMNDMQLAITALPALQRV